MTLEELRDKYSELEQLNKATTEERDALIVAKETNEKRIKELEEYNRKLFEKYVTSTSDNLEEKKESKLTFDDVIQNFKDREVKK